MTTRVLTMLDGKLTRCAHPGTDGAVASQSGGGAGWPPVAGQPVTTLVAAPVITDRAVVRRIPALRRPLAESGADLSLLPPAGGSPVAPRDLVGGATDRPTGVVRRERGVLNALRTDPLAPHPGLAVGSQAPPFSTVVKELKGLTADARWGTRPLHRARSRGGSR